MKKNTIHLSCIIITLVFALLHTIASPVHARTFYLSADGDDSAAVEHGAAFRTLKKAVSCLEPGDTLTVKEGSYEGGVWLTVTATEEAPVLIRGESLEAVISGSGPDRDALTISESSHVIIDLLCVARATRAGVRIVHSNHVQISRSRFADNGSWGIFTGFADDVLFEDNECFGSVIGIYHGNSSDRFVIRRNLIHHNTGCGLHNNGDPDVTGGDGVLNRGVIEGNIVYKNGESGGGAINMTHVQDVIVRNNLIYDNYANGITLYRDSGNFGQGSKRALIMGNTIYFRPYYGRCGVNIQTMTEKVLVAGNIIVTGGKRGVFQMDTDHLSSIESDYNIFYGVGENNLVERKDTIMSLESWRSSTGNDSHSLVANPCFVDINGGDFQIPDSSYAVDAGMPMDSVKAVLTRLGEFEWVLARLDSLPDEDIRGHARPRGQGPDAGAYETGSDPTGSYDFNGDGALNIADAVALILLSLENSKDPSLDINGDGGYTIIDVVKLIIIIMDSNPDNS